MREIAPDVFHIPVLPRNGVNAYLLGDVLVDTGLRTSARKLKEAIGDRTLQAIALTHAHGDHGGGARQPPKGGGGAGWGGAAERGGGGGGEGGGETPGKQTSPPP